jgi:hypothetical protein
MKHYSWIFGLVATFVATFSSTSHAEEDSQFKQHPRCDALIQHAMNGWQLSEDGKGLEAIVAIKNQQHRMLALQGMVVHKKGASKEESYLLFFTKCLEAHGHDLTTNGERI